MATIASPSETSLYLNAFDKTIQFDGVMKTIDDDYWTSDIVPILYPLWDSDKDKLELFMFRQILFRHNCSGTFV